jgi:hypothetical protein
MIYEGVIPRDIASRFKPALKSPGWILPLKAVCNTEEEERELRQRYTTSVTSAVVSLNARIVDGVRWKGIYVG